ncbi:hypothetical protein ACHAXT_000848 [Thalassiosira profunda]
MPPGKQNGEEQQHGKKLKRDAVAGQGDEVIVIDSDDESEDRKPSSKTAAADDDAVEHICFLDESSGMLFDTHPRTQSDSVPGGWIRASNPRRDSGDHQQEDLQGLEREFNSTVARGGGKISCQAVMEIAARHGVLYGKWLMFLKAAPALTWQKIRNALFDDELGAAAKISCTADERGLFAVCIYCSDFTDKREVLRVRQGLCRVLGSDRSLSFKADCYTHLNIYAQNAATYGLQASIYGCGGKNDPECSVLRVNAEKCTRQPGCPRCFPRCKGK